MTPRYRLDDDGFAPADTRRPRSATRRYRSSAEHQRRVAALLARASTCHWCGLPGTADDPLTGDHLVRLADGSPPDGEMVAAHRSCNSRRGQTPGGRGSLEDASGSLSDLAHAMTSALGKTPPR